MQRVPSFKVALVLILVLAGLPPAAFAQGGAVAVATLSEPEAYLTIEEVRPLFARLTVAYRPEVLTDDLALQWFQDDHGSLYLGWGRDALGERYSNANTIERQAILAEYKEQVLAEADQLRARLEAEGLKLRVSDVLDFTTFEPGVGLLFRRAGPSLPRQSVLEDRMFRHATHIGGTSFVGTLYDIAVPDAIPFETAEQAGAFLEQLRANSRLGKGYLVVSLNIRTFGVDHNLAGAPVARAQDVPVTVEVDAITIDTWPDTTDRTVRGDVLITFPTTPAATTPDAADLDITALAGRAGLITINDHLALPAGQSHVSSPIDSRDYQDRLALFLGSVALGVEPRLAGGNLLDDELRALMSEQQHLQLYGRDYRPLFSFSNEFEQRRAQAQFDTEILPQLLAAAPRLPLPVVSIRTAALGQYDFDAGSFPLSFPGSDIIANLPRHFGNLQLNQRFLAIPDRLVIDETEAEALLTSRDRGAVVYLATFGMLEVSQTRELSIAVSDIGLFADIDLTQRLATIDIAGTLEESAAPAPEPTAFTDLLSHYEPTSHLELLRHAYAALAPQGLADAIVDSHAGVRSALGFETEERRAAARALLEQPLVDRIAIEGVMEFDAYDDYDQALPILHSRIEVPRGAEGEFDSGLVFELTPDAVTLLRSVPVSAEVASRVSDNGLRLARYRAQAEIVGIEPYGNGGSVRLTINLGDMIVWHVDENDETVVLTSASNAEAVEPGARTRPDPASPRRVERH